MKMRGGGSPALLFLFAVLCLTAPSSSRGAGSPSPFDECEAKVLAQPDVHYTYFCYLQVASGTGRWRDGAERLE